MPTKLEIAAVGPSTRRLPSTPCCQFPSVRTGTDSLAGFTVEGEQHYWVRLAIDRFTGQVIDKQIEVVNE